MMSSKNVVKLKKVTGFGRNFHLSVFDRRLKNLGVDKRSIGLLKIGNVLIVFRKNFLTGKLLSFILA
ncbi:hypothetical protein P872_24045 [Rhodonellum psychrophilum GCM71 = DSM 17998]|uniref:Uncharacterized protein n=1 Tax=Rhodonellum psychrophilum GCM71 = DSM 17998 TaxID=1123057 RepID=U5C4N4_9BACT|nr:hypothetical protein P872_24045 [Rhodonellum psychrophilum GCM71 = DSM 17998]